MMYHLFDHMVKQEINKRAQALLDAAEQILEKDGISGLSARNVADRAKVNKGLVFYYWGSTNGLFEEVLKRYYERHKASLMIAFELPGSLRERVHRVLDDYLNFMEHNRTYARIVQEQVSGGGELLPLVRTHLREVLQLIAGMLDEVTPATGPLNTKHFYLSISGVVVNYFTYGPVLGKAFWGREPLGRKALAERREHVHWIVDAWLDRLLAMPSQPETAPG